MNNISYKIITLCTILLSCCLKNIQAQNKGFIQQEVIKVSGILNDSQIYTLSADQKQTSRTFYDGLGRPIQSLAIKASPLQKDIIQTITYDNLGRQTTSYLPYAGGDGKGSFNANASTNQLSFYAIGTTGDKIADDTKPYSAQKIEDSPLQRLLQAGSPGAGFQPLAGDKYKSIAYRTNTASDVAIRVWKPDGTSAAVYANNTLSVVEAADEQGFKTIQFTDALGKTVLKRQYINETIEGKLETYLDTYYVYDEVGRVKYTIPPKAVVLMRDAANWNITVTGVDKLLFKYVYDPIGRLVEKTVPGAGPGFIIYDPLNRPVLIQDGNLRNGNKWNYFKYDANNRVISQGIYVDATRIGRSAMQSYVTGLTGYSTVFYEDRTATLTNNGYYTNVVFPNTGITPLLYNYYDDYDFNYDAAHAADYTCRKTTTFKNGEVEPSETSYTRGFLTGTWRKTVGSGVSAWLISVVFYDKNGRIIQTLGNNQLNQSTTLNDSKTVALDFTGQAKQIKTVKNITSTTTTVYTVYGYDHAGRTKSVDQYHNADINPIRIADYEYNELGALVDKKLNKTGSSYLQSVDYRYNIRGQLTSINNSTLTSDNNVTNDETNDVFGMEFFYDKKESSLTSSLAYYNGLVSSVKWRAISPNNNKERSYWFTYDNIGRLKAANYQDRAIGSSWTQGGTGTGGAFDENNISYDHQGNIKTLRRNTILVTSPGVIKAVDDLTYTYDGNQLTNITDGVGTDYTSFGFKNPTASAIAYTYNVNSGNLETDPKKGISIAYNELNKTDKITVSAAKYITYTYDVTGVLIRKQMYDNSTLQKTTDYIDGFVYENSALAYFPMAEGRVRNNSGTLKYEYIIADNMGNARVSFEDNGSGAVVLTQENSYYPFGLTMPGNYTVNNPANTKLYNEGSEWQNDFNGLPELYNTFYRNYDPALDRFIAVDPKADATSSLSTYHYSGNNPILFNDPLGDRYEREKPIRTRPNYDGIDMGGMFGGGRLPGGVSHISSSNWAVQYRSPVENMALMSSSQFTSYYSGLSDLQRAQMATMITSKKGCSYKLEADDYANPYRADGNNAYGGGDGNKYYESGVGFITEYNLVPITQGQNSYQPIVAYNKTIDGSMTSLTVLNGVVESGVSLSVVSSIGKYTYSSAKLGLKTAKVLGNAGLAATAVSVGYKFATGHDNTSTIVDVGVTAVTFGAGLALGTVAAPAIAVIGVGYGIWSAAGGSDWIDENWGYRDTKTFKLK
ncbi:DUF6443 domain-containing protein [Solitalea canadensis]|nr:DUF6443 domain-containing protein [Solitalea canadensis]